MKEVLCGLRVKVKDALGALVSWLGDKRGKEMNITEWALTECQLDAFIYIFLNITLWNRYWYVHFAEGEAGIWGV